MYLITFYTSYVFILYILIYIYNYNIIKIICKKKKKDRLADKPVQTTHLSLRIKTDKGEKVQLILGPMFGPHDPQTRDPFYTSI